jgi:intracellular sulfur oxidation DsrE/DsrF family protein
MKISDHIQAGLFADGQLSRDEVEDAVCSLREDPGFRREVDEIQDLKALMKQAFPLDGGVPAQAEARSRPMLRRAVWPAAVMLAFVLGLLFPGWDAGTAGMPVVAAGDAQAPVILHVPDGDRANWADALDIAEAFGNRHVKVEVLANSSGLDLLSASRSPYAKRIRALVEKYPGLAFVACGVGLEKLRKQGLDTKLVEGVATAPSAVEHVAEQVSKGWHYIKL